MTSWRPQIPAVSNLPKEISWFIPKHWLWYLFLKRGCYQGGGWKIRWSRVLCLFNMHKWGTHIYSNADYAPTPKVIYGHVQCMRCGAASFEEDITS